MLILLCYFLCCVTVTTTYKHVWRCAWTFTTDLNYVSLSYAVSYMHGQSHQIILFLTLIYNDMWIKIKSGKPGLKSLITKLVFFNTKWLSYKV
jgi:hypothetical protein